MTTDSGKVGNTPSGSDARPGGLDSEPPRDDGRDTRPPLASVTTLPRKPRGRRLKTAANAHSGIAWVIRQLELGKIDPKLANALIYGYSTLVNIIRDTEIEDKVERLEEIARERGAL